jgi:hypothetical protein
MLLETDEFKGSCGSSRGASTALALFGESLQLLAFEQDAPPMPAKADL